MIGETSADHINFGAEMVDTGKTIYDMLQFVFPAVTFHELYSLAATEAKLKILNSKTKSLATAVTWNQVQHFAAIMAQQTNVTVEDVLRDTFEWVDHDRSGLIEPEEMHQALAKV